MTFAGVAGVGLSILVNGEADPNISFLSLDNIAFLFLASAILGGIIILILVRLRRAQVEHFRIINCIRIYFLGKDIDLWNIVQLSKFTLPMPNRKSGTYYWTLLIITTSSGLLAFALFIWSPGMKLYWLWPTLGFLLYVCFLDQMYLKIVKPPQERNYKTADLRKILAEQKTVDDAILKGKEVASIA